MATEQQPAPSHNTLLAKRVQEIRNTVSLRDNSIIFVQGLLQLNIDDIDIMFDRIQEVIDELGPQTKTAILVDVRGADRPKPDVRAHLSARYDLLAPRPINLAMLTGWSNILNITIRFIFSHLGVKLTFHKTLEQATEHCQQQLQTFETTPPTTHPKEP